MRLTSETFAGMLGDLFSSGWHCMQTWSLELPLGLLWGEPAQEQNWLTEKGKAELIIDTKKTCDSSFTPGSKLTETFLLHHPINALHCVCQFDLLFCFHRALLLYWVRPGNFWISWVTTRTECSDLFCHIAIQSFSCVRLFTTPQTAAHQDSLSFTISRSLLQLMSVELVMPSIHLILLHPLLLLPSIFPSMRVFCESALCVRWPKYWSFSFTISSSNEYSGLISLGLTSLISLLSKGLSRVFSSTTVWKH